MQVNMHGAMGREDWVVCRAEVRCEGWEYDFMFAMDVQVGVCCRENVFCLCGLAVDLLILIYAGVVWA